MFIQRMWIVGMHCFEDGPAQKPQPSHPVSESTVQTHLELWHPWGCAHSLGSMFSALPPSGGTMFS